MKTNYLNISEESRSRFLSSLHISQSQASALQSFLVRLLPFHPTGKHVIRLDRRKRETKLMQQMGSLTIYEDCLNFRKAVDSYEAWLANAEAHAPATKKI